MTVSLIIGGILIKNLFQLLLIKIQENQNCRWSKLWCNWTLSKGVEKDAIILCQDEDKTTILAELYQIIFSVKKMANITEKS